MIKCKDCGHDVSKQAKRCSNCGNKLTSNGAWIIALLFGLSLLLYFASTQSSNISTNSSINKPESNSRNTSTFQVENIRVEKSYPNAWGLKGQIRNTTNRKIKGAVKIKFLDSKGNILHSNRAKVNDNDYFASGASAPFEYYVEPSVFTNVTDFDVEFYER